MKRTLLWFAISSLVLVSGLFAASAQSTAFLSQRSFGAIARGSTVCVGPIPSSGGANVQLFGFTNGSANLTWQILTVSSQTAPTVIFETTARSVDRSVAPQGNLLFEACVSKNSGSSAQDFDISIKSPPTS